MTEKKDYTQGQSWFKIMWKNGYIAVFAIAIAALILILYNSAAIVNDSGLGWLIITVAIPVAVIVLISTLAFYKYWNDLKNGRSS